MAEKVFDGTTLGQKDLSSTEENYSLRDIYTPSCNPVVNVSRAIGTQEVAGRSELIRKHSKHINDLKIYYGREVERLNERIRSLEHCRPAITDVLQQSKQDDRYCMYLVMVYQCWVLLTIVAAFKIICSHYTAVML